MNTDTRQLLQVVTEKYKIDLTNYAPASLSRRIERFLSYNHFHSYDQLVNKLLEDKVYFDFFITELTVNTTEMFRDPDCWQDLVTSVFPILDRLPSFRIWHAGCSSGEEVFSMAILLKEYGLYNKARIVATDLNKDIMSKAQRGVYPLKSLELNTANFLKTGCKGDLHSYLEIKDGFYQMKSDLLENVRFLKHDLSGGNTFSKFDLIVCRNVLIYFNKSLQEKVYDLFTSSLFKKGVVFIGKKESMVYYTGAYKFNEACGSSRIYFLK